MAVPQTIIDLWPSDFGVVGGTPPIAILRQQATLLAQKTKNVVLGEVRTEPVLKFQPDKSKSVEIAAQLAAAISGQGTFVQTGEFRHIFYLRVPALENYRYQLFTVTSNPLDYPVQVEARDVDEVCESESVYMEVLRQILSSDYTTRIVRNLMEQVKPS